MAGDGERASKVELGCARQGVGRRDAVLRVVCVVGLVDEEQPFWICWSMLFRAPGSCIVAAGHPETPMLAI